MKALLLTTGSRGDVQPFVALALALTRSGHEAVVAAPRRFAALAEEAGAEFAPLDDALFTMQDELAGQGTRAAFTAVRTMKPLMRRWLDDVASLAGTGADIVVYAPKTLGGPHLADALGVPCLPALLIPLYLPTAEFALPILPGRLPRMLNRASWRATSAIEAPYRGMVRRWRAERLGLSGAAPSLPARIGSGRVLHAWSRHLLPAPGDWPPSAAPTGFWPLPRSGDAGVPERLARFVAEGEPPLYIGFGSSIAKDPADLTRAVLDGVARTGRRAVVATGWGALTAPESAPPANVLPIDEAPHDWLLPRVAAAVHHGGAGTVAAALRAGVPQVVRPFLGDQPFWARRVHAIGAGPRPLTGRLTADTLATAIDQAVDHAATASALAEKVQSEEQTSLPRAIEAIEAALATRT